MLKMIDERRENIKKILSKNGVVYLKDLEKLYPELSSMTLRRDLEALQDIGFAVKIRGGARSSEVSSLIEPIYGNRAKEHLDSKRNIAAKALSYIETGRSVFLDSGTTVMELAKILPDTKLNILTSGPNIALEILKKMSPAVNLIGGNINRDNLSVSGAQALSFVKSVNIDIAFMAPTGVTAENGFTCGNYTEFEVKRAIVKKANKVIVLMDGSKFDRSLPFTFATLKDIDVIVSDAEFTDSFLNKAKQNGVNVIKV